MRGVTKIEKAPAVRARVRAKYQEVLEPNPSGIKYVKTLVMRIIFADNVSSMSTGFIRDDASWATWWLSELCATVPHGSLCVLRPIAAPALFQGLGRGDLRRHSRILEHCLWDCVD